MKFFAPWYLYNSILQHITLNLVALREIYSILGTWFLIAIFYVSNWSVWNCESLKFLVSKIARPVQWKFFIGMNPYFPIGIGVRLVILPDAGVKGARPIVFIRTLWVVRDYSVTFRRIWVNGTWIVGVLCWHTGIKLQGLYYCLQDKVQPPARS